MAIIDLIENRALVYLTLAAVLGLIVGSFLNVVIYRLPIMLNRDWTRQCREFLHEDQGESAPLAKDNSPDQFNLATPGSHCITCKHKIRAWENIPVLSYLMLGGRCSLCQTRISLRYPVVELSSGILAGLIVWNFGIGWTSLALLLLSWSLLTLALIDFDHQLLPDDITQPLLWTGLLVNWLDLGLGVTIEEAVIGAVAGYLSLWSFYQLFKLLTGKKGMGFGDFKLLAALGAWMGWQSLLTIIILASLAGSVVGIATLMLSGRDRSVPIPFGPFLAAAGFIMILWGPQINALYFSTFVG